MRRILVIAVLAAMLPVPEAAADAGAEGAFVARLNAERTARGLPPLQVYWDLVDDARRHSGAMRAADDLYHNSGLGSVTSGWYALGENVGVGPGVDALHRAFMASPSHAGNITGDYNYVGVGVVAESDTKMWVTIVFMNGPAGLVTPTAPEDPAPDPPPSDSAADAGDAAPRSVRTADANPPPRSRPVGSSRLMPRPR